MARTLTAGATAWKAGPSYQYDWLVESEDLDIRWSYDTDSAGGHAWEHRLHSISEIELSVPPGGGLASANTVTITVFESETGTSLRGIWNAQGRLEGADLTVSLLPAGEAYADRIKLFTGKIDHASWRAGVGPGEGLGTLVAVDATLHNDILLPQTILTVEAYPNLPAQWQGAILPMVYGSHTFLVYAPLLLVDAPALDYRVADHAMGSMTYAHAVNVAEHTRFLSVLDPSPVDPSLAQLTLARPVTEYRYSAGTPTVTLTHQVNVTTGSNMIDGAPSSQSVIASSTLNPDGDGHGRLAAKFVWADPNGGNTLVLTLANFRRNPAGATTVTAETILRTIDATTNVVLRNNIARDGPYRHSSNPRTREFTLAPIALVAPAALEVELQIINEGGAGGVQEYWVIGELSLELFFQAESLFDPIYLADVWQGRPDTDGMITGTVGATISHAADVLRSLLVQRLGLAVHAASFTAVRTALTTYGGSAYRYDFGLGSGGWYRPQMAAAEILDTLAQQAGCYLFPAGDGTIKLAIAQGTPTSQLSLTVANMANVLVELGRLELVQSSFEVRYGWSVTQGRFTQVALATPGGCNHHDPPTADELLTMASDALDRYGPQPPRILEAYAIQDTSTADTRLATLVEYFWTQQVLVTCDTTFVAIHLEVGDVVDITHPEIPTHLQGATFEVLRITDHPEAAEGRPWPRRLVCRSVGSLTAFDYFLIKDQSGVTWYWWVNRAGELTWALTPPSIATRIAENLNLSPIPSWLVLTDPTPATRYVYPATLTGAPLVSSTVPSVGTGLTGSPTVRSMSTGVWQLDVSLAQEVMTVQV